IVERQKSIDTAIVRNAGLPAVSRSKGQFALRPGRAASAYISGQKNLAIEVEHTAGLDAVERWEFRRVLGPARMRDRVLARGIGQPAVGAVVEPDIPLVPKAIVVAHLDAPDDVK